MTPSTTSKDSLTSSQSSPSIPTWQLIQRLVRQIGQRAISVLTQPQEPTIVHRIRAGQSTWIIYDAASRQSITCYSVAEVRCWLESRYSYRRHP